MSTELRGRVKQKVWVKPYCTDESDTYLGGQQARRDFKRHAREEDQDRERGDRAIDVAAPDVIDEAFELGDPPLEESY